MRIRIQPSSELTEMEWQNARDGFVWMLDGEPAGCELPGEGQWCITLENSAMSISILVSQEVMNNVYCG